MERESASDGAYSVLDCLDHSPNITDVFILCRGVNGDTIWRMIQALELSIRKACVDGKII